MEMIVRGKIFYIAPKIQLTYTFVIGRLRTYPGELHDFCPMDKKDIWKAVDIPESEERNVQTDMTGI